jgi:large subunit ribosomal protein L20
MTRVKKGIVALKRRKSIFKRTLGFGGASSVLFRTAQQKYMKALKYSYRNRRQKKRDFRSLWISRLNAALRQRGIGYKDFIHVLNICQNKLNRKILSQLSLFDSFTFSSLLYELKVKKILSLSLH